MPNRTEQPTTCPDCETELVPEPLWERVGRCPNPSCAVISSRLPAEPSKVVL